MELAIRSNETGYIGLDPGAKIKVAFPKVPWTRYHTHYDRVRVFVCSKKYVDGCPGCNDYLHRETRYMVPIYSYEHRAYSFFQCTSKQAEYLKGFKDLHKVKWMLTNTLTLS